MVCPLRFHPRHDIILLLFYIVNMDDCWQVSRDAQGTIQADPKAFPNGIPALVDYVHSKKLKFGLYSGMKKVIFTSLSIAFKFFSIYRSGI